MPMVGLVSSAKDSPWHRAKMLDFPTPEFPITTTFAIVDTDPEPPKVIPGIKSKLRGKMYEGKQHDMA